MLVGGFLENCLLSLLSQFVYVEFTRYFSTCVSVVPALFTPGTTCSSGSRFWSSVLMESKYFV